MNTIPPLSQAGRLGALMLPQSHWFFDGPPEAPTACCFLGGAALAMGFRRNHDWIDGFLTEHWPIVNAVVPCPHRSGEQRVLSIINTLNGNGWTREAIADWLETIEPQEAAVGEEERQEVEA